VNLTFAALDRPIETLLVATASPDDGGSTVLANLAVTMAHAEQRTVLVDADLRRPELHEIFGISNERGLVTMIVDPTALEAPPLANTGIENLWVLPSGPLPPNPADILGSQKMEQVIATLKEHADVVLFTAPPVIAVTDAAVLGTKVDGVLIVVNAGRTHREHVQQAKEILERVHARIYGAVLNNAPHGTMLGKY